MLYAEPAPWGRLTGTDGPSVEIAKRLSLELPYNCEVTSWVYRARPRSLNAVVPSADLRIRISGRLIMNMSLQKRPMQPAVGSVPTREPPPGGARGTWLVVIPLVLIVIYAFVPTLYYGFLVGWDDSENLLENPYFRGVGAAQVKWAWTTFWLGVYQPLAWLLFDTQYVFCQLDPRGYHLTSVLLQVANAVVLYVLTVALLVRCRIDSSPREPVDMLLERGAGHRPVRGASATS